MPSARRRGRETIAAFVPCADPPQLSLFLDVLDVEIRFQHAENLKRHDVDGIATADAAAYDGTCEEVWPREYYEYKLCGTYSFAGVAWLGKQAVGCVLWTEKIHTLQIDRLFVVGALRRQGLGGKLLDFAIAKAGPKQYLRAFTNERNLGAECFLRAKGLKCRETIPGWYGDDDGYFFLRQLRGHADAHQKA